MQQLPLRALFLKHAGQQARSARIILLAGIVDFAEIASGLKTLEASQYQKPRAAQRRQR